MLGQQVGTQRRDPGRVAAGVEPVQPGGDRGPGSGGRARCELIDDRHGMPGGDLSRQGEQRRYGDGLLTGPGPAGGHTGGEGAGPAVPFAVQNGIQDPLADCVTGGGDLRAADGEQGVHVDQQRIGERTVGQTHLPGRRDRIWQMRGERSQRAGVLVGAAWRRKFAVAQFERRVGKGRGGPVGVPVEGVPPDGGVPGQQQQPDRRGPGRPVAHRADQVREQRDVEVGVVNDQQRRPVELQLRPPARGLRVGETSLPPLRRPSARTPRRPAGSSRTRPSR